MKQLKLWLTLSMGIATLPGAMADAPSGYYSTCEGKKGAALLSALCQKIGPHKNVGYDGLWNVYNTSDIYPNGKIWDMYSTKQWTPIAQKCGNYKNVGDCYNREHSIPQSWFKEGSPMKSDAFHVYPTDGKVNNQRGNNPYGECAGGTTLPSSGSIKALGRSGASTFPGYSGTVFEPVDEYKGDFARTYFYMAACYNDRIAGWNSDMLAGNSYPVFTAWTIDLLLKWHRQDPVSDKERTRNEAVYGFQNNRNPFIDHPDMAEHIWGTDKDTGWSSNTTPRPAIATPADGSTIELGYFGTGIERTSDIIVKGQNLTSDVTATVSGTGFSVSPSSLTASAVNSGQGATLTIRYTSANPARLTGVLTLTSGSAKSAITLHAEAVSGIQALPATDITTNSFEAHWVNIDPAGTTYRLNVTQGGASIAGYPRSVEASTESATVTGLTPGTTYHYSITSPAGLNSNDISVTTAEPIPSIQFLFDGDLYFNSTPGQPSESAELIVETENISDPVSISVKAPFELSSDKAAWATNLPLAPEQDRFYLRLNSAAAGSFTTHLCASAGTYLNDDITVSGIVSSTPTFIETFEAPSDLTSYNGGLYQGSACAWQVTGALIGTDYRDVHSGDQGLRLHKTEGVESGIEMAEPREHGIGAVTFHAKAWNGEGGDLRLDISTDGALTWKPVKTFTISDNEWTEYSAVVNTEGLVRIRLVRLSGRRIAIDDIEATDYALSAVATLEYHTWDSYCRDHTLIIDNSSDTHIPVSVHSPNGALWHSADITPGITTIDLPAGVYLVTSRGFTRKVVVR